MNEIEPTVEDGFDERDARALTEHITLTRTYDGSGEIEASSESGKVYRIDPDALTCSCGDSEYDAPDGRCKHVRRLEFASGRRSLPEWINTKAITQPFGEFIDSEDVLEPTADASSSRDVATDGGLTVREAADGAEILEDDESDPWEGPFPETDKYGELTGERYYRCRSCGREALESIGRDAVGHRDGCRFEEGGN